MTEPNSPPSDEARLADWRSDAERGHCSAFRTLMILDELDAARAEIATWRKAEHDLSDAYLRLRSLIPNAYNTPNAPSHEVVWQHTEDCLKAELARLRSANKALEDENTRIVIDRCKAPYEDEYGEHSCEPPECRLRSAAPTRDGDLRAENERLRAALQQIADGDQVWVGLRDPEPGEAGNNWRHPDKVNVTTPMRWSKIASAALASPQPDAGARGEVTKCDECAAAEKMREANDRAERMLAALQWAMPLATIAMEDCRQRRLQAGHNFGTKKVGLYDDEVDEMERHNNTLLASIAETQKP